MSDQKPSEWAHTKAQIVLCHVHSDTDPDLVDLYVALALDAAFAAGVEKASSFLMENRPNYCCSIHSQAPMHDEWEQMDWDQPSSDVADIVLEKCATIIRTLKPGDVA